MTIRATAADLISFYDERTIRELLVDSEVAYVGDLADNVKLTQLLQAASGRLEAACFVSENYTAAQLDALTENSAALAAEIVCMLVMATLMRRRPERFGAEAIKAAVDSAEGYLQQLRNGQRLFDITDDDSHEEAGKAKITWPTIEQINDNNRITRRTKHFYPDTTGDLPLRLGGG